MKILIVEDEKIAADHLDMLLKSNKNSLVEVLTLAEIGRSIGSGEVN